jgi:UDP-glucose:(heptosyl)LPS alpha-1,3-glucosyltransferase
VADAVLFAGVVSRESLPGFYLAADLFAMLSRFDTFGMVVLEAMAAGLPVLISGAVGAGDVVREGENGFVVEDPSDPEAVAERIETALNGDALERMRREALKTAGQNTWEASVARVLDVYDQILADQRRVISKMPHP